MLRGGVPHAVLITGPVGVGKTTLAMDLTAALLCGSSEPGHGPCRSCRACRLVETGRHPDVHRLAPTGPGAAIGIGGSERGRGVRELVADLVLLPVEGGWRVAIIEEAHRLTDEAQSALLKTLEEPPGGVTIILCAEEEERLLPTVRSRCARVRLAPVAPREIEAILAERELAGPPLAGRLARLSAGRPGIAIAYSRSAEAEAVRGEIARRLLDLRTAAISVRLPVVRELSARAAELGRLLAAAAGDGGPALARPGRRTRARSAGGTTEIAGAASAPVTAPESDGSDDGAGSGDSAAAGPTGSARPAAAERRRAAQLLLEIWQDVARDVLLVAIGERSRIRDVALLEELETAATVAASSDGGIRDARDGERDAAFLVRATRASELLAGNVSPELVLDTLVLHWGAPGRSPGAGRS